MAVVALLGAGIFAREEHLPAIEAAESLKLGAVYSRSKASAEALVANSKDKPDIYYDSPSTPGRSLDDLLQRKDLAAVVVSLPILVQPAVIQKALAAGKHVLSEKPIAKDVGVAKDLIAQHARLANAPIWAVAENFRFLEVVLYGAQKVKEIGGDVVTFSMTMYALVGDDDKFFNTEWRKVPEYQGGFLLDGGVHFVAGLRCMLASARQDIQKVSAFTALLQPKLAPVDIVQAIMTTTAGSIGTFCVSFGTEFKSAFEIEVVTTKGVVTLTPTEVTSRWRKDGDGKEEATSKKAFSFSAGVKPEVDAFGQSLQADSRQSPEQALKDLTLLEGMLESAKKGGEPLVVE